MDEPVEVTWHAMPVDEVVKRLATSTEKGLDATEASARLQKYGLNRLPEGKKQGPVKRFLAQFNNILVYVLLAAGFTKLMLNLWLDAAVILGVVIINALLGFIQEGKAEKALDSIRNMLSAEARTVRGGKARMIPAEELVPGDVVLLESGDKVPADLRLCDVKNLRTEEAALTGESVPADKTTAPVSVNATVGDRESMAFSGTMAVSGRATGVVVATGSETELGRINQLLASVSSLETPLLRQIKKFGNAITTVIAAVSILVFAYGRWVKRMDFVEQTAYPRIDAIPFESEHRFMATLHEGIGGKQFLLVKGAPEVILEHCDRQQTSDGQQMPVDREFFNKASDKLASQGERVLALAWLDDPGIKAGSLAPANLPRALVLLGLIGLLDPPRKEAIEAVEECHGGGIRVTMITGDHKITAAAIAKLLGIGDGKTAVTGVEIEEMDTASLLFCPMISAQA